jgi:hypothetical protein
MFESVLNSGFNFESRNGHKDTAEARGGCQEDFTRPIIYFILISSTKIHLRSPACLQCWPSQVLITWFSKKEESAYYVERSACTSILNRISYEIYKICTDSL